MEFFRRLSKFLKKLLDTPKQKRYKPLTKEERAIRRKYFATIGLPEHTKWKHKFESLGRGSTE